MGKRKNKGGNGGGNNNNDNNNIINNNNTDNNNDNNNIIINNNNNNNDNNNNNNNSNNDNKKDNNNNNNNNNGGGEYLNIVLKVDLHCEGCTKKIRKAVLSFPGTFTVEFEGETKVKIWAKKDVDFVKLKETLEKKLVKKVELISPQPPKKDEQKKDNNPPKPKELPMISVVLKIAYHCNGCGQKIYRAVSSQKGVIEVIIDKDKDLVTVKGKLDVKPMVEEIKKKLKKSVEIVPEKKNQDKKDGEKKQENSSGGKGGDKVVTIDQYIYGQVYGAAYVYGDKVVTIDQYYAPQIFSDENPNACSIM